MRIVRLDVKTVNGAFTFINKLLSLLGSSRLTRQI